MKEQIGALTGRVASLIIDARKVVVFTGAGISTESGLPDFRSPGGIWERFDPDDFTYQKYVSDPEARRKQWQMFRDEGGLAAAVEPNAAHYAVAELYKLGKLDSVITQNVDNLHQKAGVPAEKVFELHGNMQWVVCLGCRHRYPVEIIKNRLSQGEELPDCELCHGILKPDAVFFGEALPEKVLAGATARASGCDLLIVIGSSLVVTPAAYMPVYAVQSGAKLVIINLSATPMDSKAIVVIRAKAGETMMRVAQQVREMLSGSRTSDYN